MDKISYLITNKFITLNAVEKIINYNPYINSYKSIKKKFKLYSYNNTLNILNNLKKMRNTALTNRHRAFRGWIRTLGDHYLDYLAINGNYKELVIEFGDGYSIELMNRNVRK